MYQQTVVIFSAGLVLWATFRNRIKSSFIIIWYYYSTFQQGISACTQDHKLTIYDIILKHCTASYLFLLNILKMKPLLWEIAVRILKASSSLSTGGGNRVETLFRMIRVAVSRFKEWCWKRVWILRHLNRNHHCLFFGLLFELSYSSGEHIRDQHGTLFQSHDLLLSVIYEHCGTHCMSHLTTNTFPKHSAVMGLYRSASLAVRELLRLLRADSNITTISLGSWNDCCACPPLGWALLLIQKQSMPKYFTAVDLNIHFSSSHKRQTEHFLLCLFFVKHPDLKNKLICITFCYV